MLYGNIALIHGNIVGTGKDDNGLGFEVDDIGTEARKHLCRYLTTDASTNVTFVVLEEFRIETSPVPSDGVAHEYYLYILVCLVLFGKVAILCPILWCTEAR